MTLSTPFLLSYLYWLEVLLRHPPHCVKVMYFVLSLEGGFYLLESVRAEYGTTDQVSEGWCEVSFSGGL